MDLYGAHAQVTCGTLGLSTATVKLITSDGEEKIECSIGTGPVDAAYKAVDNIVQVIMQLDILTLCFLFVQLALVQVCFFRGLGFYFLCS